MNLEKIQEICQKLTGTTQDIKWEDHLCFNIGGKMYLITSPDQVPQTASFKVSEEDFITLTERDGISPARYLARYKWVQLDDINRLSETEWKGYIQKSYDLIFSKLPVKIKKEIAG